MLIALFADIHANRPAFEACLAAARAQGAASIVLLGDYVGYGGDPEWSVATVMDLVAQGAAAVRGNHDNAVGNPREQLNLEAQIAMEWTRNKLGTAERQFLAALPLTLSAGDYLYVHSEASNPSAWTYVRDVDDAIRSMKATSAHVTFCGHIHRPALYSISVTGKITAFTPSTNGPVPLLQGRRWLAVLGSVGQPRDGNPAAAYALFDTQTNILTYCRVPYDIDQAAGQIRKNGLPASLAERLYVGR